jgi:hypothetical protein
LAGYILFAACALIVGSLLFLRDSANMKIPREKLEKIRERKAEQEKKDEEFPISVARWLKRGEKNEP